MALKWIILMLIVVYMPHTQSITTKGFYKQQPNWESGLREAAYQALTREQFHVINLRELIFEAPIDGREETVSPFGDITIVARGQLYATRNQGFIFVRDSQECNGCSVKWSNYNRDQLLALWTVKRIRHRDAIYGHRYELEYTISPIKGAREDYLKRDSNFDYGLPGHVFVVKTESPLINKRQEYRSVKDVADGFHTNKEKRWQNNQDLLRKQFSGNQYLPPRVTNYNLHSDISVNSNGYYIPKFLGKPNYDEIITTVRPTILLTPPYNFEIPYTSINRYNIPTMHTTTQRILIPLTTSIAQTTRSKETTTDKITSATNIKTTSFTSNIPKTTPASTTKMQTQLDFETPSDDELFGTSTELNRKSTTQISTDFVTPQLPVPTKSIITTESVDNKEITRKQFVGELKTTTPKLTTLGTKLPRTTSKSLTVPYQITSKYSGTTIQYTSTPSIPTTTTEKTTTKMLSTVSIDTIPTSTSTFYKTTNYPTEITKALTSPQTTELTTLGSTTNAPTTVTLTDVNHVTTTPSILSTINHVTTTITSVPTTQTTEKSTPTTEVLETTTRKKTKPSSDRPDDINIFGDEYTAKQITTKSSTTQRMIYSKDVDDIFGSATPNKPKIIFSNFYEAGIDEKNSVTKKRESIHNVNKFHVEQDDETVTSQSVLTSISFEVNKRYNANKDSYILESPIKAHVKEIKNNQTNIKVFKAEMPDNVLVNNTIKTNNNLENNKVLDHLTLSVINHAKSIKLLNKRTREQKPRRRIYGVKMKKLREKEEKQRNK